jgi:hypothetical protein
MVLSSQYYQRRPTLFEVKSGRANSPEVTSALLETVRRLFDL